MIKRIPVSSVKLATGTFLMALFVVIVNALVLDRNMAILRNHEKMVAHTQEVLFGLEQLLSSAKDAETGERGYVITGEEKYLRPFQLGRTAITNQLDSLQDLTSDNPAQQDRVEKLRPKVLDLLGRFEEINDIRRQKGFDAARAEVATDRSNVMMNEIRDLVRSARTSELDLLRDLSKLASQSSEAVDRAIVVQTAAVLLVMSLAYYFIRRYLIQQEIERSRLSRESWLKGGLADLNIALRGNMSLETLCSETLTFFGKYLEIPVSTFYIADRTRLKLCGAYAGQSLAMAKTSLGLGEGLAGEAAAQKRLIHLKNAPSDYLKISSSLGETSAIHLVAFPVVYRDEMKGVIELGSLQPFEETHLELIELIRETLGVAVDVTQTRERMQALLEETQRQAEELHTQQEELRTNNEELETQAHALKSSQERLQLQQEELRQTNEELEQQARVLESQKSDLSTKNNDLTIAQAEIERKARELSNASQYKSEFLANMSHELRTPLNSMLILATLLFEDQEKRLSTKQIEFAKTIHRAGSDLLNLINDILDLSKVEAGKLELTLADVQLGQLSDYMAGLFRPLAEDKGLAFNIEIANNLPASIHSDRQRLEQILKNFLSNAIKFTEHGSITLSIESGQSSDDIAIAVTDTGIGIPADKQALVFEAFQQADGSTSRQFGGTGLGLTISRELANLLHAKIKLSSVVGQGSRFTLIIPKHIEAGATKPAAHAHDRLGRHIVAKTHSFSEMVGGDRIAEKKDPNKIIVRGDVDNINKDDRLVLIVEDDLDFGNVLLEQAHEAGFKALLVTDGEATFEILHRFHIAGVLLDIRLPDVSGLSVLERLKADLKTRHVPIHIISGTDVSQNALKMGAVGYLMKPVARDDLRQAFARIESTLSKAIKHVLIVEDDEIQRGAMIQLLSGHDIEIDAVGLGREAIDRLSTTNYDCMILDLKLPDISGFELLELLGQREVQARPPVVVYTGKELSSADLERLRRYAESIIIKGAKSPERLLDEVSLFLHRVEANLPKNSKSILQKLRGVDEVFDNRKILLVDDDMRNVFALANALDVKGMKVTIGKNGQEALSALNNDPTIELVLMDIMMPLMDGYEAMEKIRTDRRFKKLPIIALTAKAMKGDQERCLSAGANDYLPKPIQLERLLSLLRVWLPARSEL